MHLGSSEDIMTSPEGFHFTSFVACKFLAKCSGYHGRAEPSMHLAVSVSRTFREFSDALHGAPQKEQSHPSVDTEMDAGEKELTGCSVGFPWSSVRHSQAESQHFLPTDHSLRSEPTP